MRRLVQAGIVAMVAGCAAAAAPAHAAYPGDNGRIAFASYAGGSTQIVGISPDGGDQRALRAAGSQPAWSPDGRWLAYTLSELVDGRFQGRIHIASADGTQDVKLDLGRPASGATWSPDGRQIAFESPAADPPDFDIYVADVSGFEAQFGGTFSSGSVRRLTDSPEPETDPAWSPLGDRVAYTEGRGTDSRAHTVLVGGGNPFPIAQGYESRTPDWSPDGTRLAFSGKPIDGEGNADIYIVPRDGQSVPEQITAGEGGDANPAWSPDGTQIAYDSTEAPQAATYPDIWVVDTDTSHARRRLTGPNDVVESSPSWQPVRPSPPPGLPPPGPPPRTGVHNGLIAFVSNRDGDDEIFTMNPGGGDVVQLTHNRVPDSSPAWSPAVAGVRSRIAFSRRHADGLFHVYVMTPEGRALSDLGPGRDPAWSPDGQRIAFGTEPGPRSSPQIWTMAADGSDRRRLSPAEPASAAWFRPAWSPDGREIAAVHLDFTLVRGPDAPILVGEECTPSKCPLPWDNAYGYGLCFLDVTGVQVRCRDSHALEDNPEWAPATSQLPVDRLVYDTTDAQRFPREHCNTFAGCEVEPDLAGGPTLWGTGILGYPIADQRLAYSYDTRVGRGLDRQWRSAYDPYFYRPVADPTDQRTDRPVGDERDPAFAPDGGSIAASTPAGLIVVVRPARRLGNDRDATLRVVHDIPFELTGREDRRRVRDIQPDWQARLTPLSASASGRFAGATRAMVDRVRVSGRRLEITVVNRNRFQIAGELNTLGGNAARHRRGIRFTLPPAASRKRPGRVRVRVRVSRRAVRGGRRVRLRLRLVDPSGRRRTVRATPRVTR